MMDHKCEGCRYKGYHQEMMFKPMPVCNRATNLLEAIQNYEAPRCPYPKEKSYTIEEIAQKICESYEECTEGVCPGFDYCDVRKKNGILEWLRKVVEE